MRSSLANNKEACLAYNIIQSTAARRMRAGWLAVPAFGLESEPKRKAHNARLIPSAKGDYAYARAASKAIGIDDKER